MVKSFSLLGRGALPSLRFWIVLVITMVSAIDAFFLVNSYIHSVNEHALDHCHNDLISTVRGHSHCTASPAHILNVWEK